VQHEKGNFGSSALFLWIWNLNDTILSPGWMVLEIEHQFNPDAFRIEGGRMLLKE
jgi:hypothetical protein